MKWHFRPLQIGEKTREAIQGEFFSTDAIRNPTDALVREAVQNSLDAVLKDADGKPQETVRVRFFLAKGQHALPPEKAKPYFDGAWDHFQAEGNGLGEPPKPAEPCAFLVFEDFNTTGLQGDPARWEPPEGPNAFFYFFRAEGRSGKSEKDRGRWGVGKYVFPRSSRLSSFFGLTVRADDKQRLLMGQTVLRSHQLAGKHFSPDGYFGEMRQDTLVLPSRNKPLMDRFSEDFCLLRREEPGLSVVVPWIYDEDVSEERLVEAAVRGYFHPILAGTLVVTVETPSGKRQIDHETLVDAALTLGDEASRELLPLVDLAEWASKRLPQEIIRLNPADPDRPVWNENLIPSDQVKNMRQLLERGEHLAVRATLTVREKDKPPRESFFDIFMRQDGDENGRPTFIREGVIIAGVPAPRARGVRSLVVIEDRPIATLLGDSENPAHTQWQKDSSHFKGRYTYGPSYLDFVTRSVWALVQFLSERETEEDPTLLLDIFSLPTPEDEAAKAKDRRMKKKTGDDSEDDEVKLEQKKSRFKIQRVAGGFSIIPGDKPVTEPLTLDVRVAYDIRRGSALRKYHPADFRLDRNPIRIDPKPTGLNIVKRAENWLRAEIQQADFRLTVMGFDEKRDLFVNARIEEAADDSQA